MNDRVLYLPYRGAPQTVGGILQTARNAVFDYSLRLYMEKVCEGLDSKDYSSEILAPFYFMKAHTRYTRDPRSVELVRNPREITDRIRRGERPGIDCDDGTALLIAWLESLGVQCRVVTVAFKHLFHNGERQYTHVFPEAYDPLSGRWVCVDFVPVDISTMLSRVLVAKVWPM